jgi:hypothetical protein
MKDVVFYQCATCSHQQEYNSRQSYERHFVAKHVHNRSELIASFPRTYLTGRLVSSYVSSPTVVRYIAKWPASRLTLARIS